LLVPSLSIDGSLFEELMKIGFHGTTSGLSLPRKRGGFFDIALVNLFLLESAVHDRRAV
jgi:hypothetical protein